MLRSFEIHEPATVAEASRLLARHGEDAAVYAGGTELILIMKEGLAHFHHLINIKTIPGLEAVACDDGTLRLGALATHRAIERSAVVRQHAPLLAAVASQVANLRVRTVGTLGGNLCFAEPHSDPSALFVAWDAMFVLARNGGERCVPAGQFFTGILQTVREPDEVLVRIELHPFGPETGGAYQRFATHERPTAGVAAVLSLRNASILEARIAVGSVGPIPARATEAEALLSGAPLRAESLLESAEAVGRHAEVLEDLYGSAAYKRRLLTVLAFRALREAAARAGKEHA